MTPYENRLARLRRAAEPAPGMQGPPWGPADRRGNPGILRTSRRPAPRGVRTVATLLSIWIAALCHFLLTFRTSLWTHHCAELEERSRHPERGDVPGWVMVTLMTAALVALLLAVAGPALEGLFRQAIDTVTRK
ncbi:hypothetical protein QFZ52_002013 [Arthrobacter woluwensis]|nr:hypothetical protein [Arthrobacter woluwensis]